MIATAKRNIPPMTVDEFLNSTERLGPGKHILVDGVIYAMAPASPTHGIIQATLAALLRNHLRDQKMPSRVMTEAGVKPRVRAKTNVRVPDLTVSRGATPGRDDRLVDEPLITIEVLSPSNDELTDVSIMACATIPSVMEMLVVDSVRVVVEIWKRDKAGAWPSEPETIGVGGTVRLDAIGLELNLSDIYADTHLSAT